MKHSQEPGRRIVSRGAYAKARTCLVVVLICAWVAALPTRVGLAQRRSNDKPLDVKQIERLERQLSEIRHRIDQLREVNMHSQEFTVYIASRPRAKHIINMFLGNYYVNRDQKDDFRVGDRVVTLRSVNGIKHFTGVGIVHRLEGDEALFEEAPGSSTRVEDEVYVINREDTSASIFNALSP